VDCSKASNRVYDFNNNNKQLVELAVALAFDANRHSLEELDKVSSLVEKKFEELKGIKLEDRKGFCAKAFASKLSLTETLSTRFFQSMLQSEIPFIHAGAVTSASSFQLYLAKAKSLNLAPSHWMISSEEEPFFKDWFAKALQALYPLDFFKDIWECEQLLGDRLERIRNVMLTLFVEIKHAAGGNNFNKSDLEGFIHWLKYAQKRNTDHSETVDRLIDQVSAVLTKNDALEKELKLSLAALFNEKKEEIFP